MSYIVLINDEEKGPYSIENLIEYVNDGSIKPDTMARHSDSGEWWEVSAIFYRYQIKLRDSVDQYRIIEERNAFLKNSVDFDKDQKSQAASIKRLFSDISNRKWCINIDELLSILLRIIKHYISIYRYKSQTAYLLLSVIVFEFSIFITYNLLCLFSDIYEFWYSGYALPSLTHFAYGLVRMFADNHYTYILTIIGFIVLSIKANNSKNKPLFFSRFYINFFCKWIFNIVIAISLLLPVLFLYGSFFGLQRVEKTIRQPVLATLYGDGATIVTTINGTKKFAPDKIHLLLRNKISALNSAGNHGMGVVSYKNVMCKYNAAENREEWFFEVEIKQNNAPPLLYKCNAFNGKSGWTLDVELVDKSPSLAN
jgi:hypothetical protein